MLTCISEEKDHNHTTLQPESDISPVITLFADGKPVEAREDITTVIQQCIKSNALLKVCIDARRLPVQASGHSPLSLLGEAYLQASIHFHLVHFEPLDNGQCLLHYQIRETN